MFLCKQNIYLLIYVYNVADIYESLLNSLSKVEFLSTEHVELFMSIKTEDFKKYRGRLRIYILPSFHFQF